MGLTRLTAVALFLVASLYTSRAAAQFDASPPKTDQAASLAGEQAAQPAEEESEEAKAEESRRLIGKIGCTDINVYGWLDMGITANSHNPTSRYNGTLGPNDRNEFQFNQTYLVMERTLNTDRHGWDIGGRIDFLYGTDSSIVSRPASRPTQTDRPNGTPASSTAWPCPRCMVRWASAGCP